MRYHNLSEGKVFECGVNRADTPVDLLISWCVVEAASAPGDWITIDGRPVFVVQEAATA